LFQPRLFQDAVQSSWREIVAWFPRNRDKPRLRCMLELSMRAALADHGPTVVLQPFDDIANLHD